jgi:hypothetical protein
MTATSPIGHTRSLYNPRISNIWIVELATHRTYDMQSFFFQNFEDETPYRRYGLRESIFTYVREFEAKIEMYQQLWDLCWTDLYQKIEKSIS